MEKIEKIDQLLVTTSPHIRSKLTTSKIMWSVTAALVPAGVWGVYVFGLYSLYVMIASILAALLTEYVIVRLRGQENTLWDGSAFLTGLLVGFNMPPSIPIYIPVIASIFAIAVVKQTFGGLGHNWMNPALAGRVFVMFSWTSPMTTWLVPRTRGVTDAVTGASPLGFVKTGLLTFNGHVTGPMEFMKVGGYQFTNTDIAVTSWLNQHIFSLWGGSMPNGYVDLFLGNVPGCIGEVSALLLLIGAVYLFAKKIITWEIPVAYIGSFAFLVWMLGGLRYGEGLFHGDFIFHIFAGGLILGAFYMATDMVTSPLTRWGMIIYGIGAGFFTYLIRFFGAFPEGVSLSIILMNILVPLLNRLIQPKRFGEVKGEKK